jgi:hypothetical protein
MRSNFFVIIALGAVLIVSSPVNAQNRWNDGGHPDLDALSAPSGVGTALRTTCNTVLPCPSGDSIDAACDDFGSAVLAAFLLSPQGLIIANGLLIGNKTAEEIADGIQRSATEQCVWL